MLNDNTKLEDLLGSFGKEVDSLINQAPTFFNKHIKEPMEEASDTFQNKFSEAINSLKLRITKYKYISTIDLAKDFNNEKIIDIQTEVMKKKGLISIFVRTEHIHETYSIEIEEKDSLDMKKTQIFHDEDSNEIIIEIPRLNFLIN